MISKGLLELKDLIYLMGVNPAKILDLDYAGIKEGYTADLIVFDPEKYLAVEKNKLKSKGKNTPLLGKKLKGKIVLTIANGKVVYNNLEDRGELIYV